MPEEVEFFAMSAALDATEAQPLPAIVASQRPGVSSELEREVMALFDAHRGRLLGYVLSFRISVHDSEEIVQEVFLSLFRHLQLGKSKKNLHAWMFRVAHNLALKQCYANLRWRERMDSDRTLAESQWDQSPNPEEQASHAQRQRHLLAVVEALPERDQCCLRLRAEGLRYREIAHVLGISLGSVSISLTRSLARLMRVAER